MSKCILVFSGFTEKKTEQTGSINLFSSFFGPCGDDVDHIIMREWNEDPKKTAEFLNHIGVSEALVCAYSWGAGFGLREFAKAFNGQIGAVLCDPVYRSKYPWMRWRALTKYLVPTIKYPKNVEVLRWFNQTQNQPGADNVKTRCAVETLPYKHSEIDDSPEYHQAALEEAYLFLNGDE